MEPNLSFAICAGSPRRAGSHRPGTGDRPGADRPAEGHAEIRVEHSGQTEPQRTEFRLAARAALPQPPASAPGKAVAELDEDKNLILANRHARLVFPKSDHVYCAAVFYVYDGKQWRQAAVSQPIGHAVFGTMHHSHPWFGRPVQWCGLVPGYWLMRLGDVVGHEYSRRAKAPRNAWQFVLLRTTLMIFAIVGFFAKLGNRRE